jgi:hypothetical protein
METEQFKIFTVLENRHLIAVDGTDYFNSKNISCDNCSTKYYKKDDSTEYHHTMTRAVICSPNTSEILSLPPKFVIPKESNNSK